MVFPFVVVMIALFAFSYKNKQYLKTNNIKRQNTDSIPKPHTKSSFFYSHPDKLILEADSLIFYPNSEKSKINFNYALIIINGQKKQNEILKEKTIISHKITFFSKEDQMTIEKFGEAGKNGVLVFENTMIIDTPPLEFYKNDFIEQEIFETDNKIFEKAEIDALFPGGEAAWNNFIENNLKESIPVDKNAPAGTYTIWLQFIVDKEGNISNITPLTNHGYGMEEEAVLVMRSSPKWIPAVQNGYDVKSYRKQPITFHVKQTKNEISTINDNSNSKNYGSPSLNDLRQKAISEVIAMAREEGKAAYIYKGRSYVFGKIDNPDPHINTFTEQDGTNHTFLLNGELIRSIDEINKHFTRNDIKKLGLIFKDEALKRFNINEAIVSIETFDKELISKK